MPARQPFTTLCQALARGPLAGRADLHVHTTHSDGTYTPEQIVELARRSGLAAVAITDHDTVSGIDPARTAAFGSCVEIIAGVEITAEHRGRELHLLGYFFDPEDASLRDALEHLRRHRHERFQEMVERLKTCGVTLDETVVTGQGSAGAVGRRHLAEMLVREGRAGSVREAFSRYLGDGRRADVPKTRLPVADAIALVRGAGGVAAWAHPSYDGIQERVPELCALGLGALEADYPGRRPSQVRLVRSLAERFGLAVAGGSDCHGPDQPYHAVGACTIDANELELLRRRATK